MNLSEKTLLRVVACTLVAGLAVPSALPTGVQTGAPTVYAEETKAANKTDALLQKPLEKTRCTVNSGTEFKMNGRTYTQGIIMGDKTYEKTASITYDINGIKTISFIPGSLDNTYNGSAKFDIYLDDVLYDTFTLNRSDSIQDERVINNEDGAAKLKIVKTGADSQYALADVTFDGVKSEHSAVTAPAYKTAAAFVGSAYNGIRVTPFSAGGESSYFKMHGRQYFQGVVLGDGTYEKGSEVMFNVENVKTLAFSMGHVDNSASEATEISVYLDDVLAETYSLTQNEGVSEYKLDVSKAKTVRFVKSGAYTKYAIADISVDDMAPAKTYSVPTYKSVGALLGNIYNNYRVFVYDGSSQANFFGLNGRKYYQGIVMGDGSYEDGAAFSLNVETLSSLEFTVGHVDGTTRNSTEITIYVDNVPTEKVDIATGYPLANVKLDVSKAKTVRIVRTGDYSRYAIADIKADDMTTKFTYTVPEYQDTSSFITSGYDKYRTDFYKGESKATKFNVGGRTYYQGIVLGDGTYEDDAAVSYNVENVKEISFDLGHVDDSNTKETELKILLDNETVKTIPLTYNMPVTTQKIDVSGAKTIRFYKPGSYSKYALANVTVDELKTVTPGVVPEYKNGAEFAASAYDTVYAEKYTDDNKFKNFKMDDTQYTQGITLGKFTYEKGGRAVFNVENVDAVAFTLGCVSGAMTQDDVLEVYADSEKIDTISLSPTMKAKEYSYDLSGVSRLMFSKPGSYATCGLGNFKINKEVTASPAPVPTATASPAPTATAAIPTAGPTAIAPTAIPIPTVNPTIDPQPTELVPTAIPTAEPTNVAPTGIPIPTVNPTIDPQPTELVPTAIPTTGPTNVVPTAIPIPTVDPSIDPVPTELIPTASPNPTATAVTPTASPKPTATPTASPVPSPSAKPLVDLSGDGKTTTSDVRVIMKAIVGKIKLTAEQEKGADVDGNGKLDSVDAVLYLKRVVADAANED